MFGKNFFFNNSSIKLNNLNKNIEKTSKIFKSLKLELENSKIPLLESFKKDYIFDFTRQDIKKFSKYKNIIIIGMGGSILGIKSIYSFFLHKVKKNVFFFDNLDINLYSKFNKISNLKNSCIVVISKSGNTLETISNLNIIFSKKIFKNKLIIISEIKDSVLYQIANNYNATFIEHREFISGRYSVMSEAGMLPASLMGLNIKNFKNLNKLLKNKKFISTLIKNTATIYTLYLAGIKTSVILNYDTNLRDLGYWYQQLVGESLAKKGKGITPILSTGPKDHHSLLQLYLDGPKDKFFTFINSSDKKNKYKITKKISSEGMKFLRNKNIKSLINAQCKATKNIFNSEKIPFRSIDFNKIDENEIGAFFTFSVLETILLARLQNINPYDQPAVEKVKIETKKILS